MTNFRGILKTLILACIALQAPNYASAQDSRLANQAAICSVAFEVVAGSQKGTRNGDNANKWSQDFRRLAMREGMGADKFSQNREGVLKEFSTTSNDVFGQVVRGCLVTGEKVGIIRD